MTGHGPQSPAWPEPVRLLVLPPASVGTGRQLDGIWWPRSGDAIGELTALIPQLDLSRDPVMMLMLSVAGWVSQPARLALDQRRIPLVWLRLYRDLLIATSANSDRTALMVVPPKTSGPTAAAAIAIALDPANHAPPPDVLARAARVLTPAAINGRTISPG